MSTSDDQRHTLKRLPSGIPALDSILNGGFLEGGSYMIMGRPGAGKTILGNQICFNHVARGGRAVYLTLLAETHSRMLAHISSMSFFDQKAIGDSLIYISGYTTLERDGLPGLIKLISQVIREYRCEVLVLDGLSNAEANAPSTIEYRVFLHEMQVLIETINSTAFLLAQTNVHGLYPEHTMVDGLVILSDLLSGPLAVRELEVAKFRGSDYLRGKHTFEINQEGIRIYPRTEAVLASTTRQATYSKERCDFGVRSLDEMLQGGLATGSTTLLLGASGSGKTSLGLHFLQAGLKKGEKALYLGFFEPSERLLGRSHAIGLEFESYIEDGSLKLLWVSASEIIPDKVAANILEIVQREGIKRLIIDGVEPFHDMITYQERTPRFFKALLNELMVHDVTTCITAELPELFSNLITIPIPGMSLMVDNVIFLRYVELRSQLYRLISVLKLRDGSYDPSIREFKIDEKGITVASTFRSAEAILTGVARPLPTSDRPSGAGSVLRDSEEQDGARQQEEATENNPHNRR